jgi:acyl-coenzyme A thioesterase PaaI-like protein
MSRPTAVSYLDELLQMRLLDDGTTEMDPHDAVRNGVVGTIQGGAQATMAEVAAERALAGRGPYLVSDLHLRYLSALKVGPAVARAEVLPGDELRPVVRVSITDGGADGRLVSTAIAVCRPDPWT